MQYSLEVQRLAITSMQIEISKCDTLPCKRYQSHQFLVILGLYGFECQQ